MQVDLPQPLLHSLEGLPGFERHAFEAVHQKQETITSIRVNPMKEANAANLFHQSLDAVPWSRYGFYLHQRPSFTFDPFFHAGCYYVQEASSMFLEQAILQTCGTAKPLKVLDLCAAPGGKSTHLLSLLSNDSLLVSNEVIKSRANVLSDNIMKWGAANVVVSQNDPSQFKRLEGFFDVLVIDAPCSGSGLFRRDPEAIQEWSEAGVMLCSQRQQRIIADALPCLKEGGILIYSTCSYSLDEDEKLCQWLVKDQDMKNIPLQINKEWNISASPFDGGEGYRFYPHKLKGEGFFLAAFEKTTSTTPKQWKGKPFVKTSTKEKEIVGSWAHLNGMDIISQNENRLIFPKTLMPQLGILQEALYIQMAGIDAGAIAHNKLVLHHALALSHVIKNDIADMALSREEAIAYLQKKETGTMFANKGWQTVSYCGHRLGWVNVLDNRVNNYYPKSLRILKEEESGLPK